MTAVSYTHLDVYKRQGYQIPESGKAAKGTNIINILQVEPGERVQTKMCIRDSLIIGQYHPIFNRSLCHNRRGVLL